MSTKQADRGGRPEHAWMIKDKPGMSIGESTSSAVGVAPLFSPWEAEQRIEALVEFDVQDVGSARYYI
jgi:hypothetical protein